MAKVAMLAVVVILSLEVDHAVTCAFMSKTVSLTAVADGRLAGSVRLDRYRRATCRAADIGLARAAG